MLSELTAGAATHGWFGHFECDDSEAQKALLHRFAAAGAALRYCRVESEEVQDVRSLDVALPRNEEHWVASLSGNLADKLVAALYYGHFFCHVFHRDYLVRKGTRWHRSNRNFCRR